MEAPDAAVVAGEYPESAGEEEAYPCKGCGEVSFFYCPLEMGRPGGIEREFVRESMLTTSGRFWKRARPLSLVSFAVH